MHTSKEAVQDTITVAKTLTYNVRRSDTVPLPKQKAWIKQYWGDKLLTKPVLLKGNRNYITFTVLHSPAVSWQE